MRAVYGLGFLRSPPTILSTLGDPAGLTPAQVGSGSGSSNGPFLFPFRRAGGSKSTCTCVVVRWCFFFAFFCIRQS